MSRVVTTRDIVIPAGTEVGQGPSLSRYLSTPGEILIGVNKDLCGSLRIDLKEGLKDGLFKVTE